MAVPKAPDILRRTFGLAKTENGWCCPPEVRKVMNARVGMGTVILLVAVGGCGLVTQPPGTFTPGIYSGLVAATSSVSLAGEVRDVPGIPKGSYSYNSTRIVAADGILDDTVPQASDQMSVTMTLETELAEQNGLVRRYEMVVVIPVSVTGANELRLEGTAEEVFKKTEAGDISYTISSLLNGADDVGAISWATIGTGTLTH